MVNEFADSRATLGLWPRGAGRTARWAAVVQEAHTGQRRGVSGEAGRVCSNRGGFLI